MLSIKELLELRKQIKNKKPDFVRQDAHKKKRLSKGWRRPRGLHSKVRLNLRGRGKNVSVGYRSPKKARQLHKSGLQQCIIRSTGDLEGLDAKKNCLVISSSLGDKKRILILKKSKELGFNILNIKNPDEYVKKIEEKISLRKKTKKEKEKKGKETKAEKKEEKLAEKVKEEDKKEIEKKEKDKILTKKDK
jgi:large subunit ribosomal protein L32e|tara:strand:+ start:23128 stop:23700 length:573 start_codon:yes stop_codon:yes gene_type:complete